MKRLLRTLARGAGLYFAEVKSNLLFGLYTVIFAFIVGALTLTIALPLACAVLTGNVLLLVIWLLLPLEVSALISFFTVFGGRKKK